MDRASRKIEHIEHTLNIKSEQIYSFNDVKFVHQSLPNTSVDQIDLHTKIGELNLSSPIFINAMTGGGGHKTVQINRSLAKLAKKHNLAIAVGSQMAALKDQSERSTYTVVRKEYPEGIIVSNLGSEATVHQAKEAVEMIDANAIQIHLNTIQELVMPEGDRNFEGALTRIAAIVESLSVPVIVKEVGFGMSKETASKLASVGVTIVDIGGYGGTNFSKIENLRRESPLQVFDDWGIPTTASICEVKSSQPMLSLIGSGGIKTGLDIAKALSLGASAVGIAGLFLKQLFQNGIEGLDSSVKRLNQELTMIMTALGINKIEDFRKVPLIINGETFHWLEQRGINTKDYSLRTYQK